MIATKNTYDLLSRVINIARSSGENVLADYHYKWDAANRITDFNFGKEKTSRFDYDKTSQLIAAKYDWQKDESYQYDLNGNRNSASIQGLEKKYKTGSFNRLLAENGDKLEYDAEGNRIAKGATKYEWDNRNRLVKVVSPEGTVEYTYDYQNRLVKRSVGKNTTHFVHDGWQIVRQLENGSPVKRFLWGTKQDELLCENDNWMLGDHLNTIREVVDTNGKSIVHYDYNAFGKCLSPLPDSVDFAYTGKLTDMATGLQWNINRWYDANIGRWISEDPIGFKGRDENLYRYVGNNNSFYLDVYGLSAYQSGTTDTPNGYPLDLSEHGSLTILTWAERRMVEGIALRLDITVIAGWFVYPDAAYHLHHFATGNGAIYTIRFARMNSESTGARNHLISEINDALAAAENLNAFNIVTTNESWANNTSGNWEYAVGQYRTWAKGAISTLGNDCFRMAWSFRFRDNYDWELDDYDAPFPNGGGGVLDYEMALLDRFAYGNVSEYEMIGQQDFVINWKKGQRYGTGAKISPNP